MDSWNQIFIKKLAYILCEFSVEKKKDKGWLLLQELVLPRSDKAQCFSEDLNISKILTGFIF